MLRKVQWDMYLHTLPVRVYFDITYLKSKCAVWISKKAQPLTQQYDFLYPILKEKKNQRYIQRYKEILFITAKFWKQLKIQQ